MQQEAYHVDDCQVVFGRVHLPTHPARPLYVVASWHASQEEPLIVLTLVVETIEQARQVLRYYHQRWACEEAARFLKGRIA